MKSIGVKIDRINKESIRNQNVELAKILTINNKVLVLNGKVLKLT